MISFEEAFQKVLDHTIDLGTETLPLLSSTHRILAEDIMLIGIFLLLIALPKMVLPLITGPLKRELPSFRYREC